VKLVTWSLLFAGALLLLSGCGGTDSDDGESLEGTRWSLSWGVETPPDIVLTLGFERGRTGGHTGCNDFSVDYETDGDSITLGREVISTAAACGGTSEGMAEETYLQLFFDLDGWRIDEGELALSSDGRDVLRYTPTNPRARELVDRLGMAQSAR
jgi:heat shock protein HslJ